MQRYFAKENINDLLILNEDDMYHIIKVMRMNIGSLIEVVYDNKLHICEVIDKEKPVFKIIKVEEKNTQKEKEVSLIIPVLKEQKLDLIFQKGTELGVKQFILIETERSIIKVNNDKLDNKMKRWEKICKEASEQSKRLDIPVIQYVDKINKLNNLEGLKLICSPTSDKPIKNQLKNKAFYDKIFVAIGPEGGFSLNEEKTFLQLGFETVNLGKLIMRVETVPMFILSIINYEYME